jgi:cytochrome c oxidase subunit 3
LPRILYLNTLLLVSSSLAAEWARHRLRPSATGKGRDADPNRGFGLVLALGIAFLAGQIVAWREIAGLGLFLATNPSSSFFYLLTGAHALHLAGGLVAIGYVAWRAKRLAKTPRGRAIVDVVVIYWHFCAALWIYLLALLAAKM